MLINYCPVEYVEQSVSSVSFKLCVGGKYTYAAILNNYFMSLITVLHFSVHYLHSVYECTLKKTHLLHYGQKIVTLMTK